ncbi:Pogo transposable element with KRAB domain [Ixodes scapularis]
MRRCGLSLRRKTTVCQRLPYAYEEKSWAFHRYVTEVRTKHSLMLGQIGNADQTPVWFDMPSRTTVTGKGERQVPVLTTGNEHNRFTVMLCCTADGHKLPPFIVFKRKTLPTKEVFPPKVIVRVNEKGFFNEETVLEPVSPRLVQAPGCAPETPQRARVRLVPRPHYGSREEGGGECGLRPGNHSRRDDVGSPAPRRRGRASRLKAKLADAEAKLAEAKAKIAEAEASAAYAEEKGKLLEARAEEAEGKVLAAERKSLFAVNSLYPVLEERYPAFKCGTFLQQEFTATTGCTIEDKLVEGLSKSRLRISQAARKKRHLDAFFENLESRAAGEDAGPENGKA